MSEVKNILVTGSTDGIGKIAAIKLAGAGHHVYIHGRNAEKLNKVIAEIKSLSNNENIKGFVADFSDFEAVKNMANEVTQELGHLDVLVNNAGVYKSKVATNKSGFDMRIAVNYFAPYLLTTKLLSLLKKGTSARIINLSSAAQAPVSMEVLSGKAKVAEQAAYAQSKLALTMWSFQLAKNIKEVAIISVNPDSLLNTNMVKEAFGKFWSSADKGGNILFDLAVSEEYNGVTGKYFDNDKGTDKGMFGDAHGDAYDDDAIEQLIEKTEMILGEV